MYQSYVCGCKYNCLIFQLKSEARQHLANAGLDRQIKVIGQSETPKGLLDLRQILDEAVKDDTNLKFEAFVFGSDDYLASIGKHFVSSLHLKLVCYYFVFLLCLIFINYSDLSM